MIGADILIKSLLEEGVEVIFGYPGGVTIPLHDRLTSYPEIKHVMPRNEQGAAMAADAYFRVTGKPGVCLSTSGPGATNLISGIANAYMDSIGMVAITAQVSTKIYGTDAFQEIKMTEVTRPITKKNYFVKDVKDLPRIVKEAFHLARSGRPRPVHIDLPVDVIKAEVKEFVYPKGDEAVSRASIDKKISKDLESEMEKALALISGSKKPVVIAGHGIILSGASEEFKQFVELNDLPFVTTLLGLSVLPDNHPLNFGMVGMHGMAYANLAIHNADLIIAIGTRFSDRITGNLEHYAKRAKVIHIEIDPREIGKNVPADAALLGDCKDIIKVLNLKTAGITGGESASLRRRGWIDKICEMEEKTCLDKIKTEAKLKRTKHIFVFEVIEEISRQAKKDSIIVSDVGQNQMWTAHYFNFNYPGQFLSSGGLGCMGYSLPAAVGAQIARPEREVWSIMGDGGFQMNMQELGAIMEYKLPVKIIMVNNGFLGMVRQWQELFFKKNYMCTPLENPDFVGIAKSYGIEAYRVTKLSDIEPMIKKAAESENSIFLEFIVEPEANVFPMVPPGQALKDTLICK
ncbi:MAG: biosynthetic-type acetolactate synthase large subunit [Patescibacteria group bacterium]